MHDAGEVEEIFYSNQILIDNLRQRNVRDALFVITNELVVSEELLTSLDGPLRSNVLDSSTEMRPKASP